MGAGGTAPREPRGMGRGPRHPPPGVPGPQVEAGCTGPGPPLCLGAASRVGGRWCREASPPRGPGAAAARRRLEGATRPPNAPRSFDLGVARSLLRAPLSACCKTQPQHSNRTVPERDPTASHPRPTPRAPRAAPSSGEPWRRPRPGAGARGAAGSRLCGTALVPRLRSRDSGKGGAGVVSRCLVGHGANR